MPSNKKNARKKLPPSKVIITMGEKITQTQFSGKVSTVNLMNALIHLMRDTQKMSGMQYKEIFGIIDGGLEAKVFSKNPTMSASASEAAAKVSNDGTAMEERD